MAVLDAAALFAGAAIIGLIHGAEPGHGWPIAATYALDRRRTWLRGILASVLLGLGHLVSSVAVVGAYFLAITVLDLAKIDEPLAVFGVEIGGPVSIVAGILLVLLGVREYRRGWDHAHGSGSSGTSTEFADHSHADPADHSHADPADHPHADPADHTHADTADHTHADTATNPENGMLARILVWIPFIGPHTHDHWGEYDGTGLMGITWTAFVLGFAHEEEFEIIGLCTGSPGNCLPLMLVYSVGVLVALVALTVGLIAGYERYEERVEGYAEYFPTISAVVLVVMGLGFVAGVL